MQTLAKVGIVVPEAIVIFTTCLVLMIVDTHHRKVIQGMSESYNHFRYRYSSIETKVFPILFTLYICTV